MSVVPYYNKPSQEGIYQHYTVSYTHLDVYKRQGVGTAPMLYLGEQLAKKGHKPTKAY